MNQTGEASGKIGKGKYGRWIGIIYIDGIDINAEIMEKGHAKKYGTVKSYMKEYERLPNVRSSLIACLSGLGLFQ